MKALRICGLLSIAVFGWASAAPGDRGKAPSYLSEYVYLHETRNQSSPIQIAAHADMCRGSVRGTGS